MINYHNLDKNNQQVLIGELNKKGSSNNLFYKHITIYLRKGFFLKASQSLYR